MIYESSKDYGTGIILMLHDGDTTPQKVADYLKDAHTQDVREKDQLIYIGETTHKMGINPATITFIPS